jgi:hypothetical protein
MLSGVESKEDWTEGGIFSVCEFEFAGTKEGGGGIHSGETGGRGAYLHACQ